MADLRFDPISGIWVAIAKKRRERPMEFVPIEQFHQQIICPFCRGNEDETPGAIAAYHADGTLLTAEDEASKWTARIVPNKYPSLSETPTSLDCGPYQFADQDGIQELIIPTSRHVTSISELSIEELAVCFTASQNRIDTLRRDTAIKHLMLFMNCRSAAGASLGHIHFQLMGSPILSTYLQQRRQRDRENFQQRGEHLIATLLQWELEQQVRILKETEHFVMLCPYASRFSFQVWIVPKNHELPFANRWINFNAELAALCRTYIKKLEHLMESPAYNWLLNLMPHDDGHPDHWFIEIFPRLNRMAGYEIGTDIWVNPVPPETAAKRLAN